MSNRVRVRDKCTGYIRTVDEQVVELNPDYEVLDEPAVDPITGDDLPPEFPEKQTRTSESPGGRQANTKKEKN